MKVCELRKLLDALPEGAEVWVGKIDKKNIFTIAPLNDVAFVKNLSEEYVRLTFDARKQ